MGNNTTKHKVAVGLSGGVDSAVAAATLKQHGHEVIGVHMLRTDVDLPGCSTEADLADAKAVAKQLDIPFVLWDFRDEYQKKVIDRFVAEYQAGRTPNPDIWCNQAIKFGLFLEKALRKLRVDYIATGHYARIQRQKISTSHSQTGSKVQVPRDQDGENFSTAVEGSNLEDSLSVGAGTDEYRLLMGKDRSKDQSYFLYRLTQYQLAKTIFPLGDMLKKDVRVLARRLRLPVADKPDSVGVCFIGEIDLKEFLKKYLKFKPGEVVNKSGRVIGTHEGVQFYTIGQRHGFKVTKYVGQPLYVLEKDVKNNRLVVGRDKESDVNVFTIEDIHFVGLKVKAQALKLASNRLAVRVRHLGELMPVKVRFSRDLRVALCTLSYPTRGVAPGQHAVLYLGDEVVGGGVIKSTGDRTVL